MVTLVSPWQEIQLCSEETFDFKKSWNKWRHDFSLVPLCETAQYRPSLTQLTDCVVSSNFGTRLDTEGPWQGHGVVLLWEVRGKSSCPCHLLLSAAAGKVGSLLVPNADPVDRRWQLSICCRFTVVWQNLGQNLPSFFVGNRMHVVKTKDVMWPRGFCWCWQLSRFFSWQTAAYFDILTQALFDNIS